MYRKVVNGREVYRKVVNGREDLWDEYCSVTGSIRVCVYRILRSLSSMDGTRSGTKTCKKRKRVIRRWCLDRFGDEVKLSYQTALRAEVHRFSDNIRRGMKGQDLVNEVVMEWESVVNRVAKCELGEKMIVCGRAARWWDEQIKDRINARLEVYRKVVNGREDLWDEYCTLRKEIKQLVIEKKLNIWNELVEKVNTDLMRIEKSSGLL